MAALQRYDAKTDGFIEVTKENSEEWLHAVQLNGTRQHKKLKLIEKISNLHIIEDGKELDDLYDKLIWRN